MKRKLIYGTAIVLITYAYYYALKNNQTIQKKSEEKCVFVISELL